MIEHCVYKFELKFNIILYIGSNKANQIIYLP